VKERDSPGDTAAGAHTRSDGGIRIFLIADVRGYTRFTQERGDEAAARLDVDQSASQLVLNGSASEDPEGMPLTYQWYVDPPTPLPNCDLLPKPASCVGQGVVIERRRGRLVEVARRCGRSIGSLPICRLRSSRLPASSPRAQQSFAHATDNACACPMRSFSPRRSTSALTGASLPIGAGRGGE
jgi:hypothetical protein